MREKGIELVAEDIIARLGEIQDTKPKTEPDKEPNHEPTPTSSHEDSAITAAAAMVANILIGIVKFIAAAVSGSSAMLSEGIHSVVDSLNEVLILVGLKQSKKAPDALHPFGYGQNIYFYTFVVSIMIFAVGGGVAIYEGYNALMSAHETELGDPMLNYIVIVVAMVIEGFSWSVAFKSIRKQKGERSIPRFIHESKDPSIFTVFLEDTAAEIGLVFALAGTICSHAFSNPIFDAFASFAIGGLLICVSVILLVETKGLLIGEGLDPESVSKIYDIVESDKRVEHCNSVLSMYIAPDDVLLAMDVVFCDVMEDEIVDAIADIEEGIRKEIPQARKVFIEADEGVSRQALLRASARA